MYVFASKGDREPRTAMSWFRPSPLLALDVEDWRPGSSVSLTADDDRVLTIPRDFSAIDLDGYQVQAVVRLNPWERVVGNGPGNAYSDAAIYRSGDTVSLNVNQIIEAKLFEETEWSKLLRVRSKLLSEFYGRDVWLNAAVMLPASYQEHPDRRYPAILTIPASVALIAGAGEPVPPGSQMPGTSSSSASPWTPPVRSGTTSLPTPPTMARSAER